MLYWLLYSLHEYYFPFNVFRYITFRTALSTLTALLITLVLGGWVIGYLKKMSFTQHIRDDGPQTHLKKEGTPTMGGVLIVGSVLISAFLWMDMKNPYFWVISITTLFYGLIGLVDDLLKIKNKNHKGLRACYKFGLQVVVALGVGGILFYNPLDPYSTKLSVPFFKEFFIDLGLLYIPFVVFVIVGSSNAVNLTDGIDGLAIGLVAIASVANAVLVYVSGHARLADYLQVLYLPGTGELAVFCGAMFGAALGFLWFNAYPAEVFMGDVGSLSLGAALGVLAVVTKHELVLAVVGGIFVVETLSVILQVLSFKLTGRRLFKMAPIHHHFEIKGWAEPKTVVRFWIIGIILALVGLSTLKIR